MALKHIALAKSPLDANQMNERLNFSLAQQCTFGAIVSFLMRHTSDSSQRTRAKGSRGLKGSSWPQNIYLLPSSTEEEELCSGVYHGLEYDL